MLTSLPLILLALAPSALNAAPAPAQLPFLPASPAAAAAAPISLSAFAKAHNLSPEHVDQLAQHVAAYPQRRLVKLSEEAASIEITEGDKALLVGVNYVDVTDEDANLLSTSVAAHKPEPFPKKLSYSSKALEPLFKTISLDQIKRFLTEFTAFRTRYYRSETGKQSQQFLLRVLKEVIARDTTLPISVREFEHPWGQNSIIVRIEPDDRNSSDAGVVILGAHQDSTNLLPFLPASGADDDGSGTSTLLAALTSLVEHRWVPYRHPVEFHFYSAEEGGLLGSQAVAQAYARESRRVKSMLQMDMTAWVKPGTKPTIGVIRDFVSPELSEFLVLLVDEYSTIGHTDTECGYACSDHASWSKIGAPSAFAIESTFADSNKAIHSMGDRIDKEGFSFDHIREFTRVTIAMAVELGSGGRSLNFDLE